MPIVTPTAIEAVKLVVPDVFVDHRGAFSETYSRKLFLDHGIDYDFVQDNQTSSTKAGTVRGLHFQKHPVSQAKLIRVLKGRIHDVAVDLRRSSPSYGKWVAMELSADNRKQLLVPVGFAHGFCTLEDDTQVLYKVTELYSPANEVGLAWGDPELAIEWPVARDKAVLSEGFSHAIVPFAARLFRMKMMRIAVVGRSGQIARSLLQQTPSPQMSMVPLARPKFDPTRPTEIEAAIIAMKPQAVVNAAGYTAVDMAESEPDLAFQINAAGVEAVARAAARLRIPVVHLSTDYVFDGMLERPYLEDDATNPCNIYGQSKLQGERLVAAANPDHVILRTAWVYSPFGKNFVRTMLTMARTHAEIKVVNDQWGSPTSAFDVAGAIVSVLHNLISNPEDRTLRGIFHMTASGEASWAAFANAIFAGSAQLGGPKARVIPIPAIQYPVPARRPSNSRLDNNKLAVFHRIQLPAWQQSLPAIIAQLVEPNRPMKDAP
jgi:dTDP-4-dehydrorhamnose reductase